MPYTKPDLKNKNGIEVKSVGGFLEKICEIRNSQKTTGMRIYFRGQETEFWSIEPSIFRNDMLSIEHILMQAPLQKIPFEFQNLNDTFEIMTKYQHYGMCTRLLDLTTNPLVALYFACKKHGEEEYVVKQKSEKMEPYGVVYYTEAYSLPVADRDVRIISALARYDLSRDNKVENVFSQMISEGVAEKERVDRWRTEEGFEEFIGIVQGCYLVSPMYSNERLIRQNGVFLLPGLFNVNIEEPLKESVITKSRGNLRSEFNEVFFFIEGKNKDDILDQLDLCNVNEGTLFPELEHQLNYIRDSSKTSTHAVSGFEKFQRTQKQEGYRVIGIQTPEQGKFLMEQLKKYIKENVDDAEMQKRVLADIEDNQEVDWYKRAAVLSRMRRRIALDYTQNGGKREEGKALAEKVVAEAVKLWVRGK